MSRAATGKGGSIDGIQTRATTALREDDDDGEEYQDNVYEYDAERLLFKRYQPPLKPVTTPKPRHLTIKP